MPSVHWLIPTASYWLGAVVVAGLATACAATTILSRERPDLVLRLSPSNGDALVRTVDKDLVARGNLDSFKGRAGRAVEEKAKRALRVEPLQSGTLRILATVLEVGRTLRSPRDIMLMSETVSRRDLITQVWLIEDAVSRDDVADALKHYDRALSAHPGVGSQLFAVLARALDEPEIRRGLSPYLRADRPWAITFLDYAITNAPAPVYVAALFKGYGGSRQVAKHRPLEGALLQRLVAHGDVEVAASYARLMAGSRAPVLDNIDFSEASLDPDLRPLSWMLSNDPSSVIEFDAAKGLSISVDQQARITASSRVFIIPAAGQWTFGYTVELPSLSPMGQARWEMQCVGESAGPFWSQAVPTQPGTVTYRHAVNLPAMCRAVVFNLFVAGADDVDASRIAFRSLRFTRAAR